MPGICVREMAKMRSISAAALIAADVRALTPARAAPALVNGVAWLVKK